MLNGIQHSSIPSLDNICFLITENILYDDIGNSISDHSKRQVFCGEIPTSSTEFFRAGQLSIRSECVLVIDTEEDNQEEIVIYNDDIYTIYRKYKRADGLCELYLRKKVGV